MIDHECITVDLAKIQYAPWNYKEEDAELLGKLLAAIKKNGYLAKITVAERQEEPGTLEVIDGNHRLKALLSAGVREGQAIYTGVMSRAERIKVGTALNELAIEGDALMLAEIMKDLQDTFAPGDLAETMPMSQEQIVNYKATCEDPFPEFQAQDGVKLIFGTVRANISHTAYEAFTGMAGGGQTIGGALAILAQEIGGAK